MAADPHKPTGASADETGKPAPATDLDLDNTLPGKSAPSAPPDSPLNTQPKPSSATASEAADLESAPTLHGKSAPSSPSACPPVTQPEMASAQTSESEDLDSGVTLPHKRTSIAEARVAQTAKSTSDRPKQPESPGTKTRQKTAPSDLDLEETLGAKKGETSIATSPPSLP